MQAIVDAPQETVPRKVRPPRAGRLGTAQVVAAEIGLLAVIGAGYALPPALALPVAVVVVAGTLVVVGRYRGRWWYELGAAVMQLRRRQALARAAPQDSAATSEWRELCRVAPDVTISQVEHRNMNIGLGLDDQGWFAAIELAAPDGLTATGAAALPLGSLTRLAGPLSTVQLLTRVAPFSGADPRSPCAESYRELRAMLAVPAERQAWIVVRLAPGDAADAAADRGGDIGGVHATLSAALARIGEELTSRGIPHHVLDGPGLRQALVAGYGRDLTTARPTGAGTALASHGADGGGLARSISVMPSPRGRPRPRRSSSTPWPRCRAPTPSTLASSRAPCEGPTTPTVHLRLE
jgi:type VII secretion protein EccE